MQTPGILKKTYVFMAQSALPYIIPLAALSLYTGLQYFYTLYSSGGGFPQTHDSYWYMDHAQELLQGIGLDWDFNSIFYISYYGLLALLLLLFKTETAMILLQVILLAFGVILVFRISEMVFNRRIAVLAGIVYMLSDELKKWSVHLLTDSLFVFCLLLSVYLILMFHTSRKKPYMWLFAAVLAYTAFLRPAGTMTAAFILLYLLVCPDYTRLPALYKKRPALFIVCALGLTAFIPALLFAAYKVWSSPLSMSFYWNLRWLLYDNYSAGQIFDIPTAFDHRFEAVKSVDYGNNFVVSFFIHNWFDILLLYGKRFISFWGEVWIWTPSFNSLQETAAYLAKLLPLLAMAAGMLRAFCGKMTRRVLLLFVPILSAVLFCVVFFIDYGWRYRLPSVPFSGIFIACGIDWVLQGLLHPIRRRLC